MSSIYAVLVRPIRKDFPQNMTSHEEKIIGEHFNYLQSALNDGRLVLAGPCTDAAFGLAIFRAGNDQEAHDFMTNDPAVKQKLFSGEVHPYRMTFYEKSKE